MQPKTSVALHKQILEALDRVGGVDYLVKLAEDEPKAFAALLSRVLPLNVAAARQSEVTDITAARERLLAMPPEKREQLRAVMAALIADPHL